MQKFLVLFKAPAASIARYKQKSSLEVIKAEMSTWIRSRSAILGTEGGALVRTKRVDAGGGVEWRNDVTGFCIVEAESHDKAAAVFTPDLPHFQFEGSSVEVMEMIPMVGKT